MNDAEVVARKLADQTTTRTETAQFVRMEGRYAVVNIGTSSVTIPCLGVYPPRTGLPVRVEWVNGSPAVKGLVTPRSPFGKITATGTPLATVLVEGNTYQLRTMEPYAPQIDDDVAVDWDRYLILGKLTGTDAPKPPAENTPTAPAPFELVVRAEASGRFNASGQWGNSDPWASNTTRGLWTYGDSIKSAIAGSTINFVDIYLPMIQQVGSCAIGVHEYGSLPGFFPTIIDAMDLPVGSRDGWLRMPNWGAFLALGQRGVGVLAPGGGYTIWRGVASDGLSGALRFNGTR